MRKKIFTFIFRIYLNDIAKREFLLRFLFLIGSKDAGKWIKEILKREQEIMIAEIERLQK